MERRKWGRPLLGAAFGFLFGLFLGLDLLFAGLLGLDNPVLAIFPVAGLAFGIFWGRRGRAPAPSLANDPETGS